MHPALMYRPGGRLSLAELGAARLDGHVVEVGDAYMPADTVEGADARATSLAIGIPDRMAACGPTAAWIHGAGTAPPPVHHVRASGGLRLRPATRLSLVVHEPGLAAEEGMLIGGLVVASPLFTGMELALGSAAHAEYADWLRDLLLVMPGLGDPLRQRAADLPRRPGRRQARELLVRLEAGQDVVTR